MTQLPEDKGNSLMGIAVLMVVVLVSLMFFGPRTEAGHLPWWWHCLIITAALLFFIGHFAKAKARSVKSVRNGIEQCRTALEVASAGSNRNAKAKALLDLGIAYQASYDAPRHGQAPDYTRLQKAVEQLSQARDLYAELGDSNGQGLALSNLGVVYYAMNQDDGAVASFHAALNLAKTLNRPSWEHAAVQRLSTLLGEMGRGAEAMAVIKEHTFGRAK